MLIPLVNVFQTSKSWFWNLLKKRSFNLKIRLATKFIIFSTKDSYLTIKWWESRLTKPLIIEVIYGWARWFHTIFKYNYVCCDWLVSQCYCLYTSIFDIFVLQKDHQIFVLYTNVLLFRYIPFSFLSFQSEDSVESIDNQKDVCGRQKPVPLIIQNVNRPPNGHQTVGHQQHPNSNRFYHVHQWKFSLRNFRISLKLDCFNVSLSFSSHLF